MIKIIGARDVQAVCNIKAKPWLQISGPGSGYFVWGIRSWIPGLEFGI